MGSRLPDVASFTLSVTEETRTPIAAHVTLTTGETHTLMEVDPLPGPRREERRCVTRSKMAWATYHPLIARPFTIGPSRDKKPGELIWTRRATFPGSRGVEVFDPWMMYFCQRQWHACDMADAHVSSLLAEALRSIEAVPSNACAYGHLIRHILILAGTNVETRWKDILAANNYLVPRKKGDPKPRSEWTVSDHIKISPALRLPEYKVRMTNFPEWAEMTPFDGWIPCAAGMPIPRPPWYDAFITAKHDGVNLREATLQRALEAVAASLVMRVAMFGDWSEMEYTFAPTTAMHTTQGPLYGAEDRYVGYQEPERWKAADFVF